MEVQKDFRDLLELLNAPICLDEENLAFVEKIGLSPISSLGYPDLPSIIHSCHPEPWTDEDQACFRIWFSLFL